jgi:hypothetical protein
MTDRIYDLAFEAGWLAFAQELRTRLANAEEPLELSDVIEILDAELAYRDAATCRRSVPAPRRGEPAGNVVAFNRQPGPEN